MSHILSVDQSSTSTGAALFVDGKLKDYWLIKPKSSKRVNEIMVSKESHLITITMPEEQYNTTLLRTTVITDEIERLIEQYAIDVVYFEEIFMNAANPKSFRSLARLQGFIAHACWKHNVRYVIVEETKWIKTFGTYTREDSRSDRKADVMKKINDLYGLEINIDDVSDAIAIGAYAISIEKEKMI